MCVCLCVCVSVSVWVIYDTFWMAYFSNVLKYSLFSLLGLSHKRIFRRITRRVDRFSIRSHTLNDLSFFRTVSITC